MSQPEMEHPAEPPETQNTEATAQEPKAEAPAETPVGEIPATNADQPVEESPSSGEPSETQTEPQAAPDAEPQSVAEDTETPAEPQAASDAEPQAGNDDQTLAVSFSADEILGNEEEPASEVPVSVADAQLLAVLEAIIYVTDEPLTLDQIAEATVQPRERIAQLLEQLCAEYDRPERGLSVREVAGGFRMTTKAEHHEAVRRFVKNLNPPMKLSLPALETLAVIAYKQPITAPEIMEIRGVQGAGVLKTLLDRKLIAVAGRKQVIGKPILYKTTKEFLLQFGLKNLQELPTLKEFQELGNLAGGEPDGPVQETFIEMHEQPNTPPDQPDAPPEQPEAGENPAAEEPSTDQAPEPEAEGK